MTEENSISFLITPRGYVINLNHLVSYRLLKKDEFSSYAYIHAETTNNSEEFPIFQGTNEEAEAYYNGLLSLTKAIKIEAA